MATLKTDFLGFELKSPLIAGSAGITSNLDLLKRAEDAGAGAVIMKGLSDQNLMRKSPSPRFRCIQRGEGATLYSYEQASEWGPDEYALHLEKCKAALEIPIFVNVDCTDVGNWLEYCSLIEEAGADGLELNVSCPHGSITFNGDQVEERILEVVRAVRGRVKLPFLLKLSPQLTQPLSMSKAALDAGADGLTVFNRLTGLQIDPEKQEPVMHGGYAGHGGRWALQYMLRWVSAIYNELDPVISASGGVGDAGDAIQALLAGATTVQVCSAIYLEGFQIIERLNRKLLSYLEQHGLEEPGDLRGVAAKKIKTMAQVDRVTRQEAHIRSGGTAPCTAACPAGQEAAGYITLIAQGRDEEALELIKRTNPFPAICGRVCHRPCEGQCTREKIDESLGIADLKRFVADRELEMELPKKKHEPKYKEKVAVIGSGPAGLTCALDLVRAGFPVTVFEALPVAGGMLTVGIPSYRLPKEIIGREIQAICDEGVELKTNCQVGRDITIEELKRMGYQYFVLATGAHRARRLEIAGEKLAGVESGISFLKKMNLGEAVQVGERVVVIGGGNVAIDAARSAWRLGADDVTILYRRSQNEMPADTHEIDAALAEGIKIIPLASPVAFLGEEKVEGVRYAQNKLGEPDSTGRAVPISTSREFELPADQVLVCIGQEAGEDALAGIRLATDRGILPVNSESLRTEIEHVFAGGDVVGGPTSVVEAIAAGHKLAKSILQQQGASPRTLPMPPVAQIEQIVSSPQVITCRQPKRYAPVERRRNFEPYDFGLSEARARAEAARCLHCSGCVNCGRCSTICIYDAIEVRPGHSVVTDKCDGCGLCQYVCPVGAIEMVEKKGSGGESHGDN